MALIDVLVPSLLDSSNETPGFVQHVMQLLKKQLDTSATFNAVPLSSEFGTDKPVKIRFRPMFCTKDSKTF
jgi:hypothetical protein